MFCRSLIWSPSLPFYENVDNHIVINHFEMTTFIWFFISIIFFTPFFRMVAAGGSQTCINPHVSHLLFVLDVNTYTFRQSSFNFASMSKMKIEPDEYQSFCAPFLSVLTQNILMSASVMLETPVNPKGSYEKCYWFQIDGFFEMLNVNCTEADDCGEMFDCSIGVRFGSTNISLKTDNICIVCCNALSSLKMHYCNPVEGFCWDVECKLH